MTMPYAYHADMYCDDCGRKIADDCDADGIEDEGDTEGYPQFDCSSGEADCPQHCANCGEFLENELTDDGREYVLEAVTAGRGDPAVLAQWSDYYGIRVPDEDEDE